MAAHFSTSSQCQIPCCYTCGLVSAGATQGELPAGQEKVPWGITVSHNSFSRYYGWHLRIFLYRYALSGILFTLWIILRYDNKKGTLFRGFLFMQLWFVKRRNYSSTLTYTPPLRQDSVAALAMRTGRRPSIAPTAVGVSLLIASTKEITWLMNAWL